MTACASQDGCVLTVVLPCLNEARTLEVCIVKALGSLREIGVAGEVLIADNGSTDGSQAIARRCGARVVEVATRGYGAALRAGIGAATGRYVLMADADDSYALDKIGPFVDALQQGNDLVVGNRFRGGIEPGAMPALHRYLGNPVLSFVGRVFFKIPVGDFHCGIRAFDREKALALGLRSDGMEFASEIIVKFALTHHRIVEVPTVLRRDGRDRPPHLRSWRDGWRHLRFLLLFSPRWLFLYPGAGLAALGALLMLRLILGPLTVGSTVLDTQSLLFAGGAVVIGSQAILFAVLSRTYAADRGILPTTSRLRATAHPFALERGLFLGSALLGMGGIGAVVAVLTWAHHGFGALSLAASMRLAIPTVTCLSLGAECFMGSFFLGLLQFDQHISAAPRVGPLAESSDMPDLLGQGELR